MAHGGSRSIQFDGRRWIAAGFGLIATLALTASSGPADFIEHPFHQRWVSPQPKIQVSPAPVLVDKHRPIPFAEELAKPIIATGAVGAELLHDTSAAAPSLSVTVAPEAIIPRTNVRTLWVEVTAYCPCKKCCGPSARGVTSSGKPITYNDGHFLAADHKVFPYGTRLIVPGYNNDIPVEVIDRGGAIRGYHIDIFMPSHQEAVEWGKRRLKVTVME